MTKTEKFATLAASALAALALSAPATALGAPVLDVSATHKPGEETWVPVGSHVSYEVSVSNGGDEPMFAPTEVEFTVPAGMTITQVTQEKVFGSFELWECSVAPGSQSASCTGPSLFGEPIPTFPGEEACEAAGTTCRIFFYARPDLAMPFGPVTPTIEACGGGAASCATAADTTVDIGPADFHLTGFDGEVLQESGDPATQAGSHPHTASTDFAFGTASDLGSADGIPGSFPIGQLKDAVVRLPPGLVGNAQAYPSCTQEQLGTFSCPAESQVGVVDLFLAREDVEGGFGGKAAVYNMEVPFGLPALFAFSVEGNVTMIYGELRTGGDYGVTLTTKNAPQTLPIIATDFTFWGVPADPAHDAERNVPGSVLKGAPSEAPLKPFISLPTSCVGPVETLLDVTSWEGEADDASFISHDNTEPVPNPIGADGCNAVPFAPEIEARPTTNRADAPSGLDVNLHIPQSDDPNGLATAHLKDTTVTLPEGLVLNPSGANGLDGCSESEIDLDGAERGDCPDASRVADVQVETPLLANPMPGSVYLADPFENPFNSLLALYIEVDDKKTGIVVKLPGEVSLDSDGQISATFKDNPQLPFEEFDLEFFGGSGGALRTPAVCGDYDSEAKLTPWTAPEGQPVNDTDTWAIQSGCADSESQLPHAPAFDAGTISPIAGADSPFVMHLRREDGSQNISAVNVSPPPGLLAKLAGTSLCPEPFLAAAQSKDGEDEQSSPSCPATSRLGRVVAGAGAGPAPYYAPGIAYLAGPYKGAPVSIAVITPAVAGPFDLGTIVTRIAAHVDPATARITAVSDPLPESLEGIPLDIRTVDVAFDKPGFTRNPTSCDPLAVDGLVVSTLGALAPVQSRFQVGECGRLGFQPKVFLRLFGKRFTRGSNPRLRAIVMPREGDANIARTSVTMPRSLFLDQSHIRTVCTRVQFVANACPAGSVYGSAIAFSPLVDYPLSGNVYLRSSDNKLPDLVADLRGPAHQPVRVEVVGRTDSVKGALRNTFDVVPDAPVSKFVLHLQAGKKSLLVASRNLCKGAQRARIAMAAQNGRQLLLQPKIRIPCGKQRKGKGKGKRRNRASISRAVSRGWTP